MAKKNSIDRFIGQYRFLSNFYPVKITFGDILYPSVEHAYQAAKTTKTHIRLMIAALHKAGDAKRQGRKLIICPEWELIKLETMEELLRKKFYENAGLKRQLIKTKDFLLVEGNYWNDTFWGVCRGEGLNHLGRLLMQVRQEVQEDEQG